MIDRVSDISEFLWAGLGGLTVQVAYLYQFRHKGTEWTLVRVGAYVLILLNMAGISGAITYALLGSELDLRPLSAAGVGGLVAAAFPTFVTIAGVDEAEGEEASLPTSTTDNAERNRSAWVRGLVTWWTASRVQAATAVAMVILAIVTLVTGTPDR